MEEISSYKLSQIQQHVRRVNGAFRTNQLNYSVDVRRRVNGV